LGTCSASFMDNQKPLPSGVRALVRAAARWMFSVDFGGSKELSLMALGQRDQGFDCLKAGDHEQALRHATKVIQLHGSAPAGYALRAHVCRFSGDTQQGIADATECIRLCSRRDLWILIDAFCTRGELFLGKKGWENAAADAAEAIRLTGSFRHFTRHRAWAHQTRGNALLGRQHVTAALSDFAEAFRMNPRDVYSFRQQAYCHYLQGNFDEAIRGCTEALRLDPTQAAWCCATRAAAHLGKGELDEAIASYTDAIRRDREYAQAYASRGEAHRRKGELAAARLDFTQALKLDPADADTRARFALVREE